MRVLLWNSILLANITAVKRSNKAIDDSFIKDHTRNWEWINHIWCGLWFSNKHNFVIFSETGEPVCRRGNKKMSETMIIREAASTRIQLHYHQNNLPKGRREDVLIRKRMWVIQNSSLGWKSHQLKTSLSIPCFINLMGFLPSGEISVLPDYWAKGIGRTAYSSPLFIRPCKHNRQPPRVSELNSTCPFGDSSPRNKKIFILFQSKLQNH